MKVVQLVMARQYRGAEIFAWQLSKHLVASGVDVHYVSLFKSSGQEFVPEGVNWTDLSAGRSRLINLGLILQLKKLFNAQKPDIVQANAGETLKYAVLTKLLFGFKFKIVFRNASTVSLYVKSNLQRRFNQSLYNHVHQVLSVSQRSMNDFIQTFPAMTGRIQFIPNGIEMKSFNRTSQFNTSVMNLIHVGGFSFEKNHAGLIRIFLEVKKKIPSACLWLFGDGPLKSRVEELVKVHGVSDIKILGTVSNPLDYIAAANVLMLPSILEGMPGVILEALYCRTPVVAYDVGGISEVIKSNQTGWLVKLNDESGFVDSVVSVIQSTQSDRDRITESGYEKVVTDFDNKVIAARFLKAYLELDK